MSVRRIFVEKKPAYAVKAGELREELESYLGIDTVENVRVLIRYDIENLSEETYGKALVTIFSEPPVDEVYEEEFPKNPGDLVFSVEYLPGQFDQRADSAEQCVKLLKEDEEPVIRSATTYVITAVLTPEQEKAIKGFCINPVDSREAGEDKPSTLVAEFEVPEDIKNFEGFAAAPEAELKALYDTLNLAMTFKDFLHIQRYFRDEERRDPTVTEIRVLDTYWSDHCRHTTFSTELKNVTLHRRGLQKTHRGHLQPVPGGPGGDLQGTGRQVRLPYGSGPDGHEEAEERGKAGGHGDFRRDQRLQHRGAGGDRRRHRGVAGEL